LDINGVLRTGGNKKMSDIAIIGGTGLDESGVFTSGDKALLQSPFGDVESARVTLGATTVAFVPRHGFSHTVLPNRVNYKAIIASLALAGVSRVYGVCAVGSLRPEVPPGSAVVLTDFLDFTRGRQRSFYDGEESAVVHTDFTHPYCPALSSAIVNAQVNAADLMDHSAVYAAVDGPRYETPAEIRMYSSLGATVVGMTNVPEAVLAREAGLCYAGLAVVSNFATGVSSEPPDHDSVRATTQRAMPLIEALLTRAAEAAGDPRECHCSHNSRHFRQLLETLMGDSA